MKRIARITCWIALSSLAVACGGAATDEPAPRPAAASTPVASDRAGATGCEQEIARECGDGFADGCLVMAGDRPLTLAHVCVPADASAGPPCEQEIARVCPSGQSDACLVTPALATTHVCVVP